MKNMYVYILECSDGSYYTGVTNNIERRIWEHENQVDPDCFTATRLPFTIKYVGHFYGNPQIAIDFETQVKGWSRAKKEALMEEDWEQLKMLSMNQRKRNELKKQ